MREPLASREAVVRPATQRPQSWDRQIRVEHQHRHHQREGEKYGIPGLDGKFPYPHTHHLDITDYLIWAINSPEVVLFNRFIGQAMTPRKALLRTFDRIRPLAVISHHRFNIRGV